GNTATVTFTDNGPIDITWDPLLFSRGLISMGTVNMYGQTTTSFATLSGLGAKAGATRLNLAVIPTNWQVGDQLVLPGTSELANYDETLTIQAISGTQVTVSPLAYNHLAPSSGLSPYVADMNRNVILQSENPNDMAGTGHVMMMTQNVNLGYVALNNLGR